jgi:hypothetical protein
VAEPKKTIQINGRTYDSRTGALLSSPSKSTGQAGHVLDGVTKKTSTHTVVLNTTKPSIPPKPSVSPTRPVNKKSLDIKPNPKNRTKQRSSTLRRDLVKKPVNTAPHIKANGNVHASIEKSATGRGSLLRRIPNHRLSAAQTTAKSHSVSRFLNHSSTKPKLAELSPVKAPVEPTSVAKSAPKHAPSISALATSTEATKQEVFSHSIAQATHHSLEKVKKTPRSFFSGNKLRFSAKISGVVAGCFAIVLIGGFFAYQNIPSVAMRVAASQAGFQGSLPSNTPSGYSFKGPINYEKGRINIVYKSNTDDRQFSITQKPSNWNSESLLANHLIANKTRYQTYHDKGLTVYIYGAENATWVSKGIWYTIEGQGGLSSQQILSVASSL